MIELSHNFLSKTREYVLLVKFSTDDLETTFCKLIEGEGGTYFITVQKVRIEKSKLCLKLSIDIDDLNLHDGHS